MGLETFVDPDDVQVLAMAGENPFSLLGHINHEAATILAAAFESARDADQLFACLRFSRRVTDGDTHLAPLLEGCCFAAFTMPCGSSKLYSSDADGEAQNAFVQLQGFALAFLEE